MSSPLPPLQPLEITVKIQPNAECITPLQLGNITYQYPTQLTTDKISEIVTTGAPVGYSRFAAIYGREPSLSVSRNQEYLNGSANWSSSLPISALLGDADDQLYAPDAHLNPAVFSSSFFYRPSTLSVDSPRWSRRNSSVYFPQVDFFPRYNQWFASTIWSTPYDPQELLAPNYYNVLFVYVDKLAKQVYYREGRVKFTRELAFSAIFVPKLNVTSANHYVTELAGARDPVNQVFDQNLYQYYMYLTGSSTAGLPQSPGLASHKLQFRQYDYFGNLQTTTVATFAPGDNPFNRQIPLDPSTYYTYVYRPPGSGFWGSDYITYPRQTISGLWLTAEWGNEEGEPRSVETGPFSSSGTVTWIGSAPPSSQWPLE